MTSLRWQDVVNFALGVLVAISPWVLNYADIEAARWSALAAGSIVAVLSLADLGWPAAWEEWLNTAAGLWLIIAPFVLGFRTEQAAASSSIGGGVLIVILAAWILLARIQRVGAEGTKQTSA